MRLVLASASPRRRDLLQMLGLRDFRVVPADTDETVPPLPPDESVMTIAAVKARAVAPQCAPDELIIAADTLVYQDGRALGKPENEADAARMLRQLSGAEHTVYTGVALIRNGRETAFYEKTRVFFRDMTDAEIYAYIASGEPMDKAGAYGAQGLGAVFIRRIDGDFFNVMGLPLCRLVTALGEFGATLPILADHQN